MKRFWILLLAALAAAELATGGRAGQAVRESSRTFSESGRLTKLVLALGMGIEPDRVRFTGEDASLPSPGPDKLSSSAVGFPAELLSAAEGVSGEDISLSLSAEAGSSADTAGAAGTDGAESVPQQEGEPLPDAGSEADGLSGETDAEPPSAAPSITEDEPAPESASAGVDEIPEIEAEPLSFSAAYVTNRTELTVDVSALLEEELSLRLPAFAPQILIIHTHGTEAYTRDSSHSYEESDPFRTTDTAGNIIGVGDVLAEELAAQGLIVVHDRGLYDYPSYTGSYTRSGEAIEAWLRAYPDIAVVIDLHRDALGSGDNVYKTRAEVNGETAAQVMMVVGTGENGLEHPLWQENFKLSLRLQQSMKERFPTLCRPIELVNERYNQHYTTGSLIVEIGSNGNTLPEAIRAVRAFAEAAGPVLLGLVAEDG